MDLARLRVMVLGSGGREHALVRACKASPRVVSVIAAPGNGGIAAEVPCFPVNAEDPVAVLTLAQQQACNFVIIGPEAPLAAGVADSLRAAGIAVFGPGRDGARLEASKAYCKAFLARYGIPTAAYARFDRLEPALAHLGKISYPTVVKASGLAAGKGVLICAHRAEAEAAVRGMLEEKRFGSSGSEIVIEEFLEGEELSLMVLLSGDSYVTLPASQDHKRIGDGDTGLNTGGMGAYAPASVFTADLMREVDAAILRPTLRGLLAEGIDYRGVLFVGLMLTPQGPKVLEFNVRFGDPECQALLPLYAGDPIDLLYRCTRGETLPGRLEQKPDAAAVVVVAARGYPETYPKDELIRLPELLPPGVSILHAGTRRDNGQFRSAGGRVLNVVALASTLEEAIRNAYIAADGIDWPGKYYRRDIAWRELERVRA